MNKPKEMTIAFMTPRRNQLMIDRMVLAVQEFAMKHAGLDKLVIEVSDSSELRKKDETILKLTKALEFYASDESWQLGEVGLINLYKTEIQDSDWRISETHVYRGGKLARKVLKEVRPEPLIIIDEGDDDGKV